MDTPTHMPGEAPVEAPLDPPVVTYLRDNATGRLYTWSAVLAGRDGMTALDQYERFVPNAPISGDETPDMHADPNPAVAGVASHTHIQQLQAQIDRLREMVASMQTDLIKLAG